jgi:hypothetical protein
MNQFLTPQSHHSASYLNQSSNSQLFIQPFQHQQRNKLCFSLKDLNPNKSIDKINEMIKKNEFKIKATPSINASNKQRLFHSETQQQQQQQQQSVSTNEIDETDGLIKQKPTNTVDSPGKKVSRISKSNISKS